MERCKEKTASQMEFQGRATMTYGHRNGSDRVPVIPTGTATAQGKEAPQGERLNRRAAEMHVGVLQWVVLLTACTALLIGCGTKTALSSGNVATASSASTSSGSPASTSATPNFSPAPGVYNSAQTITISAATAGATIYYTTDGSTPTTSSPKYTGPIVAGSSATIKAISSASGYANSVPATAAYIISVPGTTTTAATKTVTISDATTGATIYYTLDGSTPTTSSARYTGPITVDSTVTIKAIAIAKGYTPSAVGTVTVSDPSMQQAASPTISPGAGTYLRALMVTISDSTPGAVIYYTINGTVPTTSSARYASAIEVTSTTTIQAIAVAAGYANSPVASATFTMN